MKILPWLLFAAVSLPVLAGPAVTAGNKLGLKLALETSKIEKGNYMVSPLSLMQALTLAANGTGSQTRAEVETLLGSNLSALNADSSSLVKSLSFSMEEKKKLQAVQSWVNPAIVGIHNSVWNTNGKTDGSRFTFSPEFKKVATTHFSAEMKTLDFKDAKAADQVNKWAEVKTNGLVKEIIKADILSELLWVVMNATYIESNWAENMQIVTNSSPVFTLENGEKVVPTMLKGKLFIGHSQLVNGATVATLPFSSAPGKAELEMVVYLPARGSRLDAARSEFFSEFFWQTAVQPLAKSRRQEARIMLPKFSFDTSVEMKDGDELTSAMGLDFLFSDLADFKPMATPDSEESKVSLIKQNSRIELDEKGVKAAAVTIIGGVRTTSVPAEPSLSLTLDRPFLFAIVEKQSQAILFAGSMVKP